VTPERFVAECQDADKEISRRAGIALSSERDLGNNAIRPGHDALPPWAEFH
jgi:hypothetical protein